MACFARDLRKSPDADGVSEYTHRCLAEDEPMSRPDIAGCLCDILRDPGGVIGSGGALQRSRLRIGPLTWMMSSWSRRVRRSRRRQGRAGRAGEAGAVRPVPLLKAAGLVLAGSRYP
jgi:hypothetical protein